MVHLQARRLTPLVLLFALLQAMAPAFAAIADAWRLDQRTPYAHVESETESTCVVVHAHDCVLCSVATAPTGEVRPAPAWCTARASGQPPITRSIWPAYAGNRRSASQRAPPEVRA